MNKNNYSVLRILCLFKDISTATIAKTAFKSTDCVVIGINDQNILAQKMKYFTQKASTRVLD